VRQVLCRRTKNNAVLIGEPGVGKTAIVEGLRRRSSTGMSCTSADKRILALDIRSSSRARNTAVSSKSASRS
jgi:ATP-dependent Clp protease ATP-binding subunit ClpA